MRTIRLFFKTPFFIVALIFFIISYSCKKDEKDLEVNNEPEVAITQPDSNSSFAYKKKILFTCQAIDEEDGNLKGGQLLWSSSINHVFGIGDSLVIDYLSIGTHVISIIATDSDGAYDTDSINIEIIRGLTDSITNIEIQDPVGIQKGEVTVTYTITDINDSNNSIDIFFFHSRDEISEAKIISTSTGKINNYSITDIPPGTHSFVWDSEFDFPNNITSNMIIEMEMKGRKYESREFEVDNTPMIVSDGSFTDIRDGNNYDYKVIGTQTWMMENLAFLPEVGKPDSISDNTPYYGVFAYEGSDVTEAKATDNYNIYGALYSFDAAINACPAGWHLPGDDEWIILEDYLIDDGYGYKGDGDDIAKSMASRLLWIESSYEGSVGNIQLTNNKSNFSALPGGYVDGEGEIIPIGHSTRFWTSTIRSNQFSRIRYLSYFSDYLHSRTTERTWTLSVRCIKGDIINTPPTASFYITPESGPTSTVFTFDASYSSDVETPIDRILFRWDWTNDGIWDTDYSSNPTMSYKYSNVGEYTVKLEVMDERGAKDTSSSIAIVTLKDDITDDRDRNGYKTITIGTQTWMAENLAWLPSVSNPADGSVDNPYYYVYGYEGTNVSEAKTRNSYEKYGVYYNWEAAKTACLSGWHLPSDEEWKTLEKYLGMSESNADDLGWRNSGSVGKKLKSTTDWRWSTDPNGDGSSGFQAYPVGGRYINEDFVGFGSYGQVANFWSSTQINLYNSRSRTLRANEYGVGRGRSKSEYGFSVRCLKDK